MKRAGIAFRLNVFATVLALAGLVLLPVVPQAATAADDRARLEAVVTFADNVLAKGRDRYRGNPTPLFADGINVETGEQVRWGVDKTYQPVISDLACQQNLLRTLAALTALTGEEKYRKAAEAAFKYHFGIADRSGLLQWGGHRFIDLETLQITGPRDKGLVHELKNCFPYYDLMYAVDPRATVLFIKAFWNAHVLDWDELYVSRHGEYGLRMGKLWENTPVNLPPLRESTGLSFINAGSDLIYAAGTLYRLTKDQGALRWAKHLAYQYVAARNPETGLGAYQFTQPAKRAETSDDNDTNSKYGDRAKRQFGSEFGGIALEANVLFQGNAVSIYGENALMQFQLARELGQDGADLLEWTRQGMVSFAKYAYDEAANLFKPMFTDGVDLSGYTLKRDGYYGKAGSVLKRYAPDPKFLLSYARGYLYTKDALLWKMARNIGKGFGLGDLGSSPGKDLGLNLETACSEPRVLFAVIDLYQATANPEYLKLARVIGNNIVKCRFNRGYFTASPYSTYAQFDAVEPLALLTLEAAIKGRLDQVPPFIDGNGFIDGAYVHPDGRTEAMTDSRLYG